MKILVSHPGKQYVHRLIEALVISDSGREVLFCSPFWLKNLPSLKWLPLSVRKRVLNQLHKKYFEFKQPVVIKNNLPSLLKKEIVRRVSSIGGIDKAQFNLERAHDRFTSKEIKKYKPNIVIGYEISSVDTFKIARQTGAVVVLDLAQIHYKTIDSIARAYGEMEFITHSLYYDDINKVKQQEYELADYVLTLSSLATRSLIENGIPQNKIYEVNLGFDVNLFNAKDCYKETGSLKMMICGTDMARKGLALLLNSMKKLQQRGFDLELTIVGPQSDIQAVLNRVNIPANVQVLPFMTQSELVSLYQKADVFVFPSYLDSWAMTVIEAMACGTPVIVSDNTGSKDAVEKGGGVIVATGSEDELENTIVRFYNNRKLLCELGQQARAVAEKYTWEQYYDRVDFVLKDIFFKRRLSHEQE